VGRGEGHANAPEGNGYLSGEADGAYGKGTKQAVAGFQKANGLSADGVASLGTLYVLHSDGAIPTST
jgi:peptidoglycan hydrolase-like protein with peptidoglycan-binding domain